MIRAELVEDFKPVLATCFAADEDLISRWHIYAGRGLGPCVEKTFDDLKAAGVDFFRLADEELAGYFAREAFDGKQFLTGFFLMPKFRDEETKAWFWGLVEAHFNLPFYCGLFEKNIPANKFVQNQGGRPIGQVDHKDGTAVLYKIGA